MVSDPPPPTAYYNVGLNLKICQNFVFFLNLWGDKPLLGKLKLYGGAIFIHYTFIILFL